MILFTQSTAVIHKYFNDKLKIFSLLQFFPKVAQNSQNSLSFPCSEKTEYSRFSRFVVTLTMSCMAKVKVKLTQPQTVAEPAVAGVTPVRIFISVVLPAPLCPSSAVICPS